MTPVSASLLIDRPSGSGGAASAIGAAPATTDANPSLADCCCWREGSRVWPPLAAVFKAGSSMPPSRGRRWGTDVSIADDHGLIGGDK
jgi:hypothetical protein